MKENHSFLKMVILLTIMLATCAEANCSIEIGAGYMKILNNPKLTSVEKTLIDTPGVLSVRNVNNSAVAGELSFGCKLNRNIGFSGMYLSEQKFSTETVATSQTPIAIPKIPVNIPINSVRAKRTLSVRGVGIFMDIGENITENIYLRVRVGKIFYTMEEEDSISIPVSLSNNTGTFSLSEKATQQGRVPAIMGGIEYKIQKNYSVFFDAISTSGVRIIHTGIKLNLL